ncbi:hypothetical protein [Niallia sp. Krafla_26]
MDISYAVVATKGRETWGNMGTVLAFHYFPNLRMVSLIVEAL